MFYRLKDNFVLRGYEKLPYAVVNIKTGAANFIDGNMMNALEYCNGNIDLSLPVIPEEVREYIAIAEKAGVIEPCEQGHALTENQKYKLYPARYIRQAHWSITGKCNYRCRHCYMSAPEAKLGELSHDTVMNIARQLGDCGVMNVSLTGGEPLVRSDFLEIVDALLERNIRITQIYSNGALVNEKLLNELDKRGIHPEFNMSYDGMGWHDWLRGINGAEKTVDRAFALCREMGFPTGSEMCLHQYNKHTLRESIKHLGSLGVRSLKTNPVTNLGEWQKNNYGEAIPLKELFALYLDYIPHYYEDNMPLTIMLGGFFLARPKEPDIFDIPLFKPDLDPETFCVCGHARSIMYISPEGRTLPCMALSGMKLQEKFPLITEKSLSECITDSYYMKLIETRASEYLALNETCRECRYVRNCFGGCRADALSGNCDNDNIDIMIGKAPGACELFNGGWVEKIIETVKKARPNADSIVFTSPLWRAFK
ncbi:MAG: radical SAM protein [Synergistaceae bacterium]|nr:radical SAM protein [Synergistaceae bacterium]